MQSDKLTQNSIRNTSTPVKGVKIYSITRRLVLSLVITVILVSTITITPLYLAMVSGESKDLLEKAEEYRASLAGSLELPLWNYDYNTIRAIGNTFFQNELVVKLVIINHYGITMYSMEKDHDSDLVNRSGKIHHRGQYLGEFEFALTKQYIEKAGRGLLASYATAIILVLASLLIVAGVLVRRLLSKPLHDLDDIVRSYAAGKYDSKAAELPYIEFRSFGNVLAQMGETINEQMKGLQKAEQKYRSIFENATEGIFQETPTGQIITANPAMARMLGYESPAELMAAIADVQTQLYVQPERRSELLRLLEERDNVRQFEIEFYRQDGSRIWTSSNIRTVRDERGQVLYYEGLSEDITDRKQAEQELATYREHLEELVDKRTAALEQEINERKHIEHALHEAKDAAEAANRAKSEFLANMSHELRTPLNAILGYAQLLKREKNLTAKQRDQLNTIHSSGEHLVTLISDLLDLARIETQRMEVNVHPFNLLAFLRNILDTSRLKAEARSLFVQYQALSPLPAIIRGDDRKLRQVLLNLLDNAIKYTEHGGVTLRVNARNTGVQEYWNTGKESDRRIIPTPQHSTTPPLQYSNTPILLSFQVEDTGIGISDEQMQAIFEPFTRGDSRPTEGIGLGLAICRRLVDLMGGRLSVTSEVGKGSTFTVELELEVAEAGEGEVNAPENAIIGYHGERKRLLIVDDHITNLAMLVSTLEPLGFEIETADSGEEALHKAAATRPDLILLDLLMPGIDGHETFRRLRRTEALDQVKVIGVSAAVADKDRVTAFAAACDAFMAKPVDIGELLETLKEQLQLDWIEEGAEAMEPPSSAEGSSGDTATPEKWPPQTIVDDLLDKMEWGDFTRLENILDRLEGEDEEYKGFCETIRAYARRFDDDSIINYLS